MKYLLLIIPFWLKSYGQIMAGGNSYVRWVGYEMEINPSFQYLMNKGITYLNSGDEETDLSVQQALENNWTATGFKIIEREEFDTTLHSNFILVATNTLTCVIDKAEIRENGSFIVQSAIVRFQSRGFCPNVDLQLTFIDQSISLLNTVINYEIQQYSGKKIEQIKQIQKTQPSLEDQLLQTKAKTFKDKTLLVLSANEERIVPKQLNAYGIKYKIVSLTEYQALSTEEKTNSCLFYFLDSKVEYEYIILFDLADNSPILINQYPNDKSNFSGSDIKKILGY